VSGGEVLDALPLRVGDGADLAAVGGHPGRLRHLQLGGAGDEPPRAQRSGVEADQRL